jgi:hypothetical protein
MIELMVQPAAFRDRSVSPEPLDLSVGPRRRSSSDVSRRHSDSAASDEFSDDSSSVANSQVGKRHKRKGCNPYKKSLMKRYCEFLIFCFVLLTRIVHTFAPRGKFLSSF